MKIFPSSNVMLSSRLFFFNLHNWLIRAQRFISLHTIARLICQLMLGNVSALMKTP